MQRQLYAAAALIALTLTLACSEKQDPVSVDDNNINVLNQTSEDWRNVLIVVNDHYRGGAPLLKAAGRLNAPVSQFDTGFGQRWPMGTVIRKVQVTAEGSDGKPVTLLWEIGQQRKKK
jgi:hypothetical protein